MRKLSGHFFILHSYFCLPLAAEKILRPAGNIGELDGADEVDEFAEAVLVEIGAAVVFVERAFEAGVVAFEGDHGVVHILADAGELGAGLELRPASIHRHPEDVGGEVLLRAAALTLRAACGRLSRSTRLVFVLGVGTFEVVLSCLQLRVVLVERVGDVFDSRPRARPSGHGDA